MNYYRRGYLLRKYAELSGTSLGTAMLQVDEYLQACGDAPDWAKAETYRKVDSEFHSMEEWDEIFGLTGVQKSETV